ncbi:TRAP transporter substrate-binding protein DctP [Anaerotruncus rubiinfantis]|uniref:TRAP transporter substrate-binding protein DctP n=1 Tax=Anaerotruncus rubiinfantis TaxID=1720200 RepID=UPI00082CCD8A|nr:TRAP transporter substrate-binding protein DctP [Anaerotruncus rubiinfantis]
MKANFTKKLFACILSGALLISAAGCSASQSAQSAAPASLASAADASESAPAGEENPYVLIKMAQKSSAKSANGEAIQIWCDLVNEAGVNIEMQFFPDSQLGTEQEMVEQILMGEPLILYTDPTLASNYAPQLALLNGPYFVAQLEDFLLVNETEWFQQQLKELEDKGIKCVNSRFLFGQRHMLARKPVRTPEDLAGVKIRSQPSDVSIAVVEAMGATAVPLPFAEIYEALASGVIDGEENPLATIYTNKHHETAKVVSLTGHMSTLSMFLMNNDLFNSLTEAQQKAIIDCGNQAADAFNNEINPRYTEEALSQFASEGVTIVDDVDIAAFQEATRKVYEQIDTWGAYDTIQSQLEALK